MGKKPDEIRSFTCKKTGHISRACLSRNMDQEPKSNSKIKYRRYLMGIVYTQVLLLPLVMAWSLQAYRLFSFCAFSGKPES